MNREVAGSCRRFEITDVAEVVEGSGGLSKVHVTVPEVIREMYLHGSQPQDSQDLAYRWLFGFDPLRA